MSGHAKRYPRFGGSWCQDCHEFGGIHATGCPNDETDDCPEESWARDEDGRFPTEGDTETLDAFEFMNEQEQAS